MRPTFGPPAVSLNSGSVPPAVSSPRPATPVVLVPSPTPVVAGVATPVGIVEFPVEP